MNVYKGSRMCMYTYIYMIHIDTSWYCTEYILTQIAWYQQRFLQCVCCNVLQCISAGTRMVVSPSCVMICRSSVHTTRQCSTIAPAVWPCLGGNAVWTAPTNTTTMLLGLGPGLGLIGDPQPYSPIDMESNPAILVKLHPYSSAQWTNECFWSPWTEEVWAFRCVQMLFSSTISTQTQNFHELSTFKQLALWVQTN